MKALVIGATGATGKDLVQQLLADSDFDQIDIFVRKEINIDAPKLRTHIVDFNNIDSWKELLQGDVLFSALGTTRAQAGGKKQQWVIDYDYQYNVTKVASDNGVPTMELVSSIGADPDSLFFYSRMKGELENAISKLPFKRVVIMRPPSLIRKNTDRLGETVSIGVLRYLNKCGLLKRLAPVTTEQVAQCMIASSKDSVPGICIMEADRIRQCAIK